MKLDPIGVLFRGSWSHYRERFWLYFQIILPPSIFLGLANYLNLRNPGGVTPTGGLFSLIGWVLSIVATPALIIAISRGTAVGESYRQGLRLFWPFLWISILEFFVVIGGFILLIVPGIILSVSLAFVCYALVLDGKRGMNALALSRAYVKGYWWAIVGRGLLYGILYGLILGIVSALFHAINAVLGAVVYAAALACLTPLTYVFGYLIYENLKRLKPEAEAAAMAGKRTFFKVCAIVALAALALLIVAAAVFAGFLGSQILNNLNPASLQGGTQSLSAPGASLAPTQGAVGTKVAATFANGGLAASNNIFMNDLLAAKNVPSSDGKTLTFTVPETLAPYCAPGAYCAQFLLHVQGGSYIVSAGPATEGPMNAQSAGVFTVPGPAAPLAPAGGSAGTY